MWADRTYIFYSYDAIQRKRQHKPTNNFQTLPYIEFRFWRAFQSLSTYSPVLCLLFTHPPYRLPFTSPTPLWRPAAVSSCGTFVVSVVLSSGEDRIEGHGTDQNKVLLKFLLLWDLGDCTSYAKVRVYLRKINKSKIRNYVRTVRGPLCTYLGELPSCQSTSTFLPRVTGIPSLFIILATLETNQSFPIWRSSINNII